MFQIMQKVFVFIGTLNRTYFKQGDDWSLAELYVKPNRPDRKNIAIALLKEFKDKISFKKGHRLRFDVLKSDNEINNAIESMGLSQNKQHFLHFEYNLKDYAGNKENIQTEFDSEEIAEVLSHLSPVSISEVQHWINDKKIRGVFNQERLVCAAYLLESDETMEISRIATHSNFLRQGFASKLIRVILNEAKRYSKEKVYLKVDQIKNPAISLYKSIGFKELEEKTQIWHSSYF